MSRGAGAGGFALAAFGALRIALRRDRVIIRVVPVAAPCVNVVTNVVETECVGGVASDWFRAGLPADCVVGERLRWIVSPGETLLLEPAAGGALPFGFGGKAVPVAGLGAQPIAVASGFEPGDTGDGLLGMVEVGIFPERRQAG